MAIEGIKQLCKVNGQTQAQELLDSGWVILAVCVCKDGANEYVEYHMGKAAPIGLADHGSLLSGDAKA